MAKPAAVGEVLAPESPSDPTTKALRKRAKPDDSATMLAQLASNPNVDPAKLEKMIEMVERVKGTQAREAFNTAFAQMLPEIPTIAELAKTDKAWYAPLEDIIEGVRLILARHGFALSFKTEHLDDKQVKVIGILTHEQGHERVSEFISPADVGPGRNAIQALGSARQYGKRYVTCDLLCIVTRHEDDDGKAAVRGKATEDVPVQPKNYPEWLIDLTACADNGSGALEAMWRDPKSEAHRKHLWATDKQKWERIKVRAATADVQLRSAKK